MVGVRAAETETEEAPLRRRDCSGVVGGPARLDVCGVCGGDGLSCVDCRGVPNGGAVVDACGVCSGDGSACQQPSGQLGDACASDASCNVPLACAGGLCLPDGTIRINAGAPEQAVDPLTGDFWMADTFVSSGTAIVGTKLADGSSPVPFQYQRYDPGGGGEMIYVIPAPSASSGPFTVELWFAETYGPAAVSRGRVFDVRINGVVAHQDVDIYSESGGLAVPLVLKSQTSISPVATDRHIVIEFLHKVENPSVAALVVYETRIQEEPQDCLGVPGGTAREGRVRHMRWRWF